QTKVCLQRGYGNCPRYLRGVLVIPTEELEALRRPQPNVPRPAVVAPAAPAAQPERARRGRGIFATIAGLVVLAAAGGAAFWYLDSQVASSAAEADLPAGTALSAELVSLAPPIGSTQLLHATAAIGETAAVPDTTLIYVFDLSRTTRRIDACGGDSNGDGLADTVLDCEIASAAALNAQAIESGVVGEVGLVGFGKGAVTADLSSVDGDQARIVPTLDDDGDGTPNVVEAMRSAFSTRLPTEPVGFGEYTRKTTTSPTTVFSAGIRAACEALAQARTPNPIVVFLSDGLNLAGRHVSSVLPCAPAAVFQTFAVGTSASCTEEPEAGGLGTIADLTDGICTTVTDLTRLPEILGAVVVPQITRVELTIDGGEPIDISEAAAGSLPHSGPASIEIDHPIPALSAGNHELCLTVYGSDAGGAGSVRSCSPVDGAGGRLTSSAD
ncbi:MAG TPA: hypothetical protein VES36_00325, partial [Candidatus Limnocylindrales bacterium]|nr:hypothetical protein [Candidatus Limnocylindrales bacterium]